MDTSTNFKYEVLQEECEIEASEAESEIITIIPSSSSLQNEPKQEEHVIVLNPEINNITTGRRSNDCNNPDSSSLTFHHRLLRNINDPFSLSLPPPPPYEGASAAEAPHANDDALPPCEEASASTTCLLAGVEDIPEDDLMTVLIVSNYLCLNNEANNNPLKISPRNSNGAGGADRATDGLLGPGLPSYDVAIDLPSYEEAERSKEEENRRTEILNSQQEERNHVDTTDQLTSMTIESLRRGIINFRSTDWTFFYAFFISFLFNWIGFLLTLCITSTVSGRCGALSGFGLSVVKWVAIVKHSNWASSFAEEESWLWWSLMVCGFLLFIRGCVQYVHIKYEWKRIARRLQRFYFF